MSKTTPIGKPGYNLKKAEAEILAAVFEKVKNSNNRRRKSFAIWILGEITKLQNDTIKSIWLSADDISTGKVGRHKLADDALENGCELLAMEVIMLGDYPNGIEDLPEEVEEPIVEPLDLNAEAARYADMMGKMLWGGENKAGPGPVIEWPQQPAIFDLSTGNDVNPLAAIAKGIEGLNNRLDTIIHLLNKGA